MTNVIVNVSRDDDAQQYDLEVPADLESAALVEGIMHALGWETDPYGLPIRYQVWADPPGRVLAGQETLGEAGAWDGARLEFQPLAAWVAPMTRSVRGGVPVDGSKVPPPPPNTPTAVSPAPMLVPDRVPPGATPAAAGSGGPIFSPPLAIPPPPAYQLPPRLVPSAARPILPQTAVPEPSATAPPVAPTRPAVPAGVVAPPAVPSPPAPRPAPSPSPVRGWKKLDGIPALDLDETGPPQGGIQQKLE